MSWYSVHQDSRYFHEASTYVNCEQNSRVTHIHVLQDAKIPEFWRQMGCQGEQAGEGTSSVLSVVTMIANGCNNDCVILWEGEICDKKKKKLGRRRSFPAHLWGTLAWEKMKLRSWGVELMNVSVYVGPPILVLEELVCLVSATMSRDKGNMNPHKSYDLV